MVKFLAALVSVAVVTVSVTATFTTAVIAATIVPTTHPTGTNLYAGTWNLTALTLTYPNDTISQPFGSQSYSRLILTPNFFFVSEFNSESYASQSFNPPPHLYTPGSDADNAAVVQNSLAISGTYRLSDSGQYQELTTTGSTIPNYIHSSVSPPYSTFVLASGGYSMVETLTSPDECRQIFLESSGGVPMKEVRSTMHSMEHGPPTEPHRILDTKL